MLYNIYILTFGSPFILLHILGKGADIQLMDRVQFYLFWLMMGVTVFILWRIINRVNVICKQRWFFLSNTQVEICFNCDWIFWHVYRRYIMIIWEQLDDLNHTKTDSTTVAGFLQGKKEYLYIVLVIYSIQKNDSISVCTNDTKGIIRLNNNNNFLHSAT